MTIALSDRMENEDWYSKGDAIADQTGVYEMPASKSRTFFYSLLAVAVAFVAVLGVSNFLN
jgi:hypothetical protein